MKVAPPALSIRCDVHLPDICRSQLKGNYYVDYSDETLELFVEIEELEAKTAPQSSSSFMD